MNGSDFLYFLSSLTARPKKTLFKFALFVLFMIFLDIKTGYMLFLVSAFKLYCF